MKISRRSALTSAASAVAAASLGQRLTAADAVVGSKGRVNHSVCKWCYPKIELEALAIAGKQFGLHSIELLEVKDIPTSRSTASPARWSAASRAASPRG